MKPVRAQYERRILRLARQVADEMVRSMNRMQKDGLIRLGKKRLKDYVVLQPDTRRRGEIVGVTP